MEPLDERPAVRRKGPSFIASFAIGLLVAAGVAIGYDRYIQSFPEEIRKMDEVLMIFFAIPVVVISALLVHLIRFVAFAIRGGRGR